ncbi:PucR family transcriptional regulator [Embleya sp. NPDC050154]|uniref:PucR family transcriptional regulator n=1 Tax=Embleya sp. NPDC050154 TaxID=3363988 RepID=UPI00379B3D90
MSKRFQRAQVGSGALRALIDALAEELGRSVVLDDPLVRLICSSRHFGDEDPVRVRSLLQGLADDEVIRYVLGQGVAQWAGPGFIEGRDDLGLLPRYCVPLRERGRLLGLLMVVAADKTLSAEETDAIGRAARAVAAQMYTEYVATEAEESGTHELLRGLLGTDPVGRAVALEQGIDRGLWVDAAHSVVTVVRVSRPHGSPAEVETALRAAVEGYRSTRWAAGAISVDRDRAVLLQLCDRLPDSGEITAQSRRVVESLGTFLDAAAVPTVGVGGRQEGLVGAWSSYEQALVAMRAARRLPNLRGVGDWDELGEYAVLLQLPDQALNASLVPKPLRVLTENNGTARLEETLRCFLENAGSVPRTAEALHVHRTSLYYRLRQIQEITGLDLDNGADRLVLHMGLRIRELLTAGAPAAD